MGKYEKPRSTTPGKSGSQRHKGIDSKMLLWLLVVLIVLVAVCLLAMPDLLNRFPGGGKETVPQGTTQSQNSEPSGTTETSEPVKLPAMSLPKELDGGLQLESLFQFSGTNPDSNNREGTDLATILLKNTSGSYLKTAEIAVTLTDGKKLTFTVTDLPAGKSVMAFSKENASISAKAACSEVSCSTSFEPGLVSVPAQVTASVTGTTVTLTNQTDQELFNLVVYCRCPLGEEYFGGVTYQYIIKNLPARGTATVDAVDCILGMAEVVRVEIDQE